MVAAGAAGNTLKPVATRHAILSDLAKALASAGVDTPMLDARVLICAALDIDRAALLCDPDLAVEQPSVALIHSYAERRLAGEPVARILGFREFWSLRFKITPDVLDPRADTETLVEAALDHFGRPRAEKLRVLDLGTGSGVLLAALLTEWPSASGLGVDLSPAACAIAQENLCALGLGGRAQVVQGSWRAALGHGTFDLVVSNPPYIETGTIPMLAREVRAHDPHGALDGGADGLECYREIIAILPQLLAGDGWAILELGQGQGPAVSALGAAAGFETIKIQQDLAGIDRCLALRHANV